MVYTDFHTHSQYAYAVSDKNGINGFYDASLKKGLGLISTGDALHPLYSKELNNLIEIGSSGFYSIEGKEKVKFIFGVEVALFFKFKEKGKRIHLCLLSPSKTEINSLKDKLKEYNLKSDGRPMLKMSCEDFCKITFDISEDFIIFPAHSWTPWFGVLGEKSGFDNLTDPFGVYEPLIKAIEMGMSSDTEMNSKIPFLEKKKLLANSDAHSLDLIRWGRECNKFKSLNNYSELKRSLDISSDNLEYTVKVDPAYGRYHFCGHAKCNYSQENPGTCPICNKQLTRGVLSRVNELADEVSRKSQKCFKTLPLKELIALALKKKNGAKAVIEKTNKLLENSTELEILLEKKIEDEEVKEIININRQGKIKFHPGYDGQYGVPYLI